MVLVTGARGFLGGFVLRHYVRAGWDVIGLGRDAAPGAEPVPASVAWHAGEVTLETLTSLGLRPDLIVHCAGSGSVPGSFSDPAGDLRDTVHSTAAVLEFVRQHCPGCVVVYPSSAAVYGNAAGAPVDEDSPVSIHAPGSPYGTHKLMAEQLCLSYGRHFGLSVAIVRLFSIYGEGLRKQLLWDACQKIERGDHVYGGTGGECRDWMHAEDAARLLAAVAPYAEPECPIFNGASGEPTTVRDVLHLLYRELGVHAAPRFSQRARPGDPTSLQADTSRALAIGWTPSIDLEHGIARYARWYGQALRQAV